MRRGSAGGRGAGSQVVTAVGEAICNSSDAMEEQGECLQGSGTSGTCLVQKSSDIGEYLEPGIETSGMVGKWSQS